MKSSYVANSTDRSNEVSAFVKENGNVVLNVPSKVRIYEIKVEPYVAVTNFNLSAETVTVTENKTVTVTATGFSPSNAFDKTLEWTTADENVATVANGVITGVNPGTTTITVTSVDGPSKTIGVTVLPTYSVTQAEGTEDATNWTIEPNSDLEGGETVTATYNGAKKVKSVKAVKKAADPLAIPLTIEAITAGSITVSDPKEGMQYSLNGGAKTAVTTGDIDVAAGDKVQFYGNGTTITSYGSSSSSDCTRITGSGNGFTCKVYGNIMSLVDEKNFATAKTLSADYTFRRLFYNNNTLTDASGLLLPATELATNCYRQMFMNCTALTTAPELPAPTLVNNCYYQMFQNCQKLATVTCLATSGIGQSGSTANWLSAAGSQVQGTKTVYTVSTADWTTSNNGIPNGWTRVDIDN